MCTMRKIQQTIFNTMQRMSNKKSRNIMPRNVLKLCNSSKSNKDKRSNKRGERNNKTDKKRSGNIQQEAKKNMEEKTKKIKAWFDTIAVLTIIVLLTYIAYLINTGVRT